MWGNNLTTNTTRVFANTLSILLTPTSTFFILTNTTDARLLILVNATRVFANTLNCCIYASSHILCYKRSSDCTHQLRCIWSIDLRVCELFKCTQDCIGFETAALYNNHVAHAFMLGVSNKPVEHVVYNRIGNTCSNIICRSSYFLRVLQPRRHKHGAARSQIYWIFCHERIIVKALHRNAQRMGGAFYKRAASAATRLI